MHWIEPLEGRRLLTTIDVVNSTLRIYLANGDDGVNFSVLNADTFRLRVNARDYDVAFSKVKRADIQMGPGNDELIAGSMKFPMYIDAGSGNDTMSAGDGNDTIIGGPGDDYVFGGGGNDVIQGNGGANSLLGGAGNDLFVLELDVYDDLVAGGTGDDVADYSVTQLPLTIVAGGSEALSDITDDVREDIATIFGGSGNDSIRNARRTGIYIDAGPGDDTLIGGSGNDTLVGNIGRDLISGNAGNDFLDLQDGNIDTASGGSGVDVLVSFDDDDVLDSIP